MRRPLIRVLGLGVRGNRNLILRMSCISRMSFYFSLTLRLQQPGDVQLPLRQVKSLLQVLPVAPRLDQREIDQLRPERTQDGQERLSTPPARLEVLHADRAADPGDRQTERQPREV